MVIKPKTRGFICTTAHPKGCEAEVIRQIEITKQNTGYKKIKNALILGSSTGYGLASRIVASFGMGAATVGVMFEREPGENKPGSAGYYNTVAFENEANKINIKNFTINGDAYSNEIKEKVIALLKEKDMKIDLIVYSLAAPRRTLPGGEIVSSVLKTTDKPYTNKTINLQNDEVCDITIDPGTDEEIKNTIKVMGGEDWYEWIKTLNEADVLSDNSETIAYSYIGPTLTHPIYKDGTIGRAKEDLYKKSEEINNNFKGVKSYISINKALVTQASAAIPIVPLYISILYKVMKKKNTHEGCIEQIVRLFSEKIKNNQVDSNGFIRLDDLELSPDVQEEVGRKFKEVTTENLKEYADIEGYKDEFLNLFGFNIKGVNYDEDVDPKKDIKNLI